MGIFDKIKDAIWGSDEPALPLETGDPVRNQSWGVDQAPTGGFSDLSTSVNDPAMRDIAAGGVQPISKPREIEAAQNPTARATETMWRRNWTKQQRRAARISTGGPRS